VKETKTNQNLQASSNLSEGLSTKLKNKINEEDVENFELSCFPHDYALAFREIDKRQKIMKQLIEEWQYKLSAVMDCNIQDNVKEDIIKKQ
jgi:hypothetical protein